MGIDAGIDRGLGSTAYASSATPYGPQIAQFVREYAQVGLALSGLLNPVLPVVISPATSVLFLAWRIVGGEDALAGATAVSSCRLYGSQNSVPAFTGLPVSLFVDEEDMVLLLAMPAGLPVVLPGISSIYQFWATISTAQGLVMTAPILVTAIL